MLTIPKPLGDFCLMPAFNILVLSGAIVLFPDYLQNPFNTSIQGWLIL